MTYGKEYFETNNYKDYHQRVDRYYRTARELEGLLHSLSLIDKETRILDYGCAFGYLIEGFRKLGYLDVYGYDISEYASAICRGRGNRCDKSLDTADVAIFLDVLEHMNDTNIKNVMRIINPEVVVARIPCALPGKNTFHLDVSKADPTHVNCKDKKGWENLMRECGFPQLLSLNLNTIYSSDGVYSFLAIKPQPWQK